MRRSILFAITAFLLSAPVAFPQTGTQPGATPTYRLDSVIVTATRLEALRRAVPNAVTVLGAEQLRAHGDPDALTAINALAPGVFVTERGVLGFGISQGAAGGVTMRGLGGSPNTQVLILVDGIPQQMGLFGHPFPDMLSTLGVERIEILRGAASVPHGSNAMGGVINLITRRPDGRTRVEAGLSGGSFGTVRADAAFATGDERSGGVFTAQAARTDGHRPWSLFEGLHLTGRGSMALTQVLRMTAHGAFSDYRGYDPGPVQAPRIDNWVDVRRGMAALTLENRARDLQGAVTLYATAGSNAIYDGFRSSDHVAGLRLWQSAAPVSGVIATIGIDYQRSGGDARNVTSNTDFGANGIDEVGASMMASAEPVDGVMTHGGIRYVWHSVSGSLFIPQAGVTWQVAGPFTLKVVGARGYRQPSIRELYLFPVSRATLVPELSWNLDFTAAVTLARLTVEATVFRSDVERVIRVVGPPPPFRFDNAASGRLAGIEAAARWEANSNIAVDGAFAWTDAGALTMMNPRSKTTLGMEWRMHPVTVRGTVMHIDGLYGQDNSAQPLPEFLTASVRIAWRATGSLQPWLSVENLFDRAYQTLPGYPMPPRTLMGGLTWMP